MTDKNKRRVNDETVVRRENKHGVLKDHVEVSIGTSVVEVRRYLRNPITERREDLTTLSDDGYLKPFLALHHTYNTTDVVNLSNTPILSFDKDKWDADEREKSIHLIKTEPESHLGKMLSETDDD